MSERPEAETGVDERVRAALRDFLERSDRGEAVDRQQFLAEHAEIAEALRSFLDVEAQVLRMAGQAPRSEADKSATGTTQSLAHRAVDTAAFSQQPAPDPRLSGGEANSGDLPPQFGRYRILRPLGQGAMGMVYLAEDTNLKRQVALKTSQFSKNAELLLERFYREARSAANLRHANICPVFDVGEIDGRHFISMAYIEGKTLGERIKPKSQLPERQALLVVRKLALALQEAHDRGVIHRDLKPANVMVDTKGEPIITDFGLACLTQQDDQSRITQSGTILGTPAYMSPEQVKGEVHSITGATDQYSLGVMLYEMLTGSLPFSGPMSAVIASILTQAPDPPRQRRPDLDPRIEALCLKMMAKPANERYPSMKAVADEIAGILKSPAAGNAAAVNPAAPAISASTAKTFVAPPGVKADAPSSGLQPEHSQSVASLPRGVPRLRQPRAATLDRRKISHLVALMGGPLLLLAALFFIRSDKGTVKVTVLDPDAKVTLQGESIGLDNSGESVRIRPGEGTLKIDYAGSQFETKKFTLKKGVNDAVVVEVVDDQLAVRIGADVLGQWPAKGKQTAGTARVEPNSQQTTIGPPPPSANAPFDATQAKAHQQAWANHLGVPVEFTNNIGMKFVLIPPGEYVRGFSAAEAANLLRSDSGLNSSHLLDEQPPHRVRITRAFYLQVTEVTLRQFRQFVAETDYLTEAEQFDGGYGLNPATRKVEGRRKQYTWKTTGFGEGDTLPVVNVTWNDAQEFCKWLSNLGGAYRLPTEAEWEAACRAGTETVFSCGNAFSSLQGHANISDLSLKAANASSKSTIFTDYDDGYPLIAPVGAFLPNSYGLFDMHGNVAEWCEDGYGDREYANHAAKTVDDPVVAPASRPTRIVRGGSWSSAARAAPSAVRFHFSPGFCDSITGFRVAVSIEAARAVAATIAVAAPPLANAPFDATQAKAHQQFWAKHLGTPVEFTNSIGMQFVLIPPGTFAMGAADSDQSAAGAEKPQHRVELRQAFRLGVHEVTVEQFRKFVEATKYKSDAEQDPQRALVLDLSQQTGFRAGGGANWTQPGFDQQENSPAVLISWNDANAFCRWLSESENRTYRLPTEAEWEYACRAGTETCYVTGEEFNSLEGAENTADAAFRQAYPQADWGGTWNDGFSTTAPVGSFRANPFGLCDMHGNVYEWCGDSYDAAYYAKSPAANPAGGAKSNRRVVRGGSWASSPVRLRSSARDFGEGEQQAWNNTGFRVLLEVAPTPSLAIAPFDAAQAKAHQQAWAQHLGVPVEFTNLIGMKLAVIPPGTFAMGSDAGDDNEKPVHQVTISRPFAIGVYEVKQSEYEEIIGDNPAKGNGKGPDNPAQSLSWEEAAAFCEQLSQREGKRYRLPTEAEWEYACRAGTTTAWSFGDDAALIDQYAWHNKTSPTVPQAVGQKLPNPFGLYDMHGNVWEFCSDWFQAYKPEAAMDPQGPSFGRFRVFRGGSHYFPLWESRSSNRPDRDFPARGGNLGFRVVLEIDQAGAAGIAKPKTDGTPANPSN